MPSVSDPTLNELNAGQAGEVAFINGLNADGTIASTSFNRWASDTPATYDGTGSAHKWGASSAGTASGTITFSFDPGSDWTPAEQSQFLADMTLLSDEADITFQQVDSTSSPALVIYRYGSATAPSNITLENHGYDVETYVHNGVNNSATIPTVESAYIEIGNTTDITSYTTNGANGPETALHELGHAIGLGHAGPYNGTVDDQTQQYSAYDTHLWSTMSYIRPEKTDAKYYNSYTVTGTDLGSTTDGELRVESTTQILDIVSIQQLYGVSHTGGLQGGQIFGFHCNITDATSTFFDFTIDTTPVVTIWDGGTGNTLDLSGFSQGSTVNLNPGTFSSADGLTNNIGIAFDTAIDAAVGGTGNDTFTLNTDSDTITGGGGTDTVIFYGNEADWTLQRAGDVVTAMNSDSGTTDVLTGISTLVFADQTLAASNVACFGAGTRVATAHGAVAVEALAIGDRLLTVSGVARPVRWIGHRHVACHCHPRPQDVWPVRILADAFTTGSPARDLFLSPDHAVFADGVLIPVKHLVNGATIQQMPQDEVTYYHIELGRHDVILAEGLACESYLDNGTRAAFANGGVVQLHPDFTPAERCEAIGESAGCAPLRIEGGEIARLDARLRRRATRFGYRNLPAPRQAIAPVITGIDLAALLQPQWYRDSNPDVAASGIDPALHFSVHGRAEGRLPCPDADLIRGLGLIDPATIIRTMPDVVAAGIDLADHFCSAGWREQRRPNPYFDTGWYMDCYDIPAGMNPLVHYVVSGELQGLAPSRHFDPAWYRRQYGLPPTVCALAHYLAHRRLGDFSPRPDFDALAYAQAHRASLLPNRDPYAHFLAARMGRAAA